MHDHSESGSATGRHRWRLQITFFMVLAFFGVELAAGLLSGSLALISDAGHMAADVVGLGAALFATAYAAKPDLTGRRTYGSYRAEVFASGFAVLLMLGVAVFITVEAVSRIGAEPEVGTQTMLIVGVLGLLVNIVSLVLLREGSKESLNLQGAYLEVLADALGSIGVLLAAGLIIWTGYGWWDSLIAVLIGAFVAFRAIALGRKVLAVLAQSAPPGLEPAEIVGALQDLPGVSEVHDLHVWTLTSGMDVATAHLVSDAGADSDAVLAAAGRVLQERFAISHATLQVESAGSCNCVDW